MSLSTLSLSFPTKAARTQRTRIYTHIGRNVRGRKREKREFPVYNSRRVKCQPQTKRKIHLLRIPFFFAMSGATKMVLITAQSTQLDYSTR